VGDGGASDAIRTQHGMTLRSARADARSARASGGRLGDSIASATGSRVFESVEEAEIDAALELNAARGTSGRAPSLTVRNAKAVKAAALALELDAALKIEPQCITPAGWAALVCPRGFFSLDVRRNVLCYESYALLSANVAVLRAVKVKPTKATGAAVERRNAKKCVTAGAGSSGDGHDALSAEESDGSLWN
jgi:hypothetical protein